MKTDRSTVNSLSEDLKRLNSSLYYAFVDCTDSTGQVSCSFLSPKLQTVDHEIQTIEDKLLLQGSWDTSGTIQLSMDLNEYPLVYAATQRYFMSRDFAGIAKKYLHIDKEWEWLKKRRFIETQVRLSSQESMAALGPNGLTPGEKSTLNAKFVLYPRTWPKEAIVHVPYFIGTWSITMDHKSYASDSPSYSSHINRNGSLVMLPFDFRKTEETSN
ncbi:MAG TPA: hypothetical protein PKC21_03050 [Oligoflexia bacterium]|nr:hypothetical protein [Oligoflexia bacterium]HMR24311.1 hypothetical protein [Oligoflexia bacterium]